MKRRRSYNYYSCPVEAATDVLGSRWKGVLLYHLLSHPVRFNEFRRLLPAISHRMLTLQLRELEHDGIVYRKDFKEVPPRVEYSLTELGRELGPVISAMETWGRLYAKHLAATSQSETPPSHPQ